MQWCMKIEHVDASGVECVRDYYGSRTLNDSEGDSLSLFLEGL